VTTRILPPSEWSRLEGTLLEQTWPVLPRGAVVLAVEQDGQILGCVAAWQVWHLEGLWIAPAHRGKVGVGRRLWQTVKTWAASFGVGEVVMMARSDEARKLIPKLGPSLHLACEHYAVKIGA
jgi:hypothetical protein